MRKEKEAPVVKRTALDEQLRITERDLIMLLFEGDKLVLNFISQHIHPEDVTSETDQYILRTVLEEYFSDGDISPSALVDKFTDEKIQNYIFEITFEKYSTSKRWEERNIVENEKANLQKEAEDAVKKLLNLKIDEQLKENHRRLVESETEEMKIGYMKNITELYQSKKEINNITIS
jgi:hypothetical protein